MASQATDELVAELTNPTLVTPAQVSSSFRTFRPANADLSQQSALLQRLLSIAEADETDPAISQKFEGLRRALAAMQRECGQLEERLALGARVYKALRDEALELVQAVNAAG